MLINHDSQWNYPSIMDVEARNKFSFENKQFQEFIKQHEKKSVCYALDRKTPWSVAKCNKSRVPPFL